MNNYERITKTGKYPKSQLKIKIHPSAFEVKKNIYKIMIVKRKKVISLHPNFIKRRKKQIKCTL